MSDEEQLSPAERELETALRSLRPTPARIDLQAAAQDARRLAAPERSRVWQVAAAAVLFAAIGGAWLTFGRRGEFANLIARPSAEAQWEIVAPINGPVPPATMFAYRQALARSPADLEELLDRQATSQGDQLIPADMVTVWSASLRSLPGEM